MKKIILILFLLVSANTFASDVINVRLEREKVSKAMTIISKQTGMEFAYNPQFVNINRLISVDIVDKEVEEAIALLFGNLYKYTVKGKYIIITSESDVVYDVADNKVNITETEKRGIADRGTSIDSCLSNISVKKITLEKLELDKPIEITNHIKDTIMLKRIAGIMALTAATVAPIGAQEPVQRAAIQDEVNVGLEKTVAQFSSVYPLGTDGLGSKNKEYKFSLNLLGGVNGGIDGLELGGLFNITKQNMKGVQMGGVFNSVGGSVRGVQVAGVVNHSRKYGGIQLGGLLNYAGGASEAQVGGLMNYSKDFAKVQIAGLMNYSLQASIQISVLNIARSSNFQLGVVNISDTDDGAMLGLFNYVKKGGLFEVGFASNDYIYGAVTIVTGTDRLYSILSIGKNSCSFSSGSGFISPGVGIGTRFRLRHERQGIHLELMYNNMVKNNFKELDTNASLTQLKVFYSQRMNKFTFYGGPAINVLLADVDFPNYKKPLYSIFKDNGSRHNFNLWVGAEVGMRFSLK